MLKRLFADVSKGLEKLSDRCMHAVGRVGREALNKARHSREWRVALITAEQAQTAVTVPSLAAAVSAEPLVAELN